MFNRESWAQLQYLENHPKQLVHAVCGPNDLLMWNLHGHVITSFDFAKAKFHYVDKGKLLYQLGGLSPEMFLDVCLIAGFEWLSTFPPLDVKNGGEIIFDFQYALDLGICISNFSS